MFCLFSNLLCHFSYFEILFQSFWNFFPLNIVSIVTLENVSSNPTIWITSVFMSFVPFYCSFHYVVFVCVCMPEYLFLSPGNCNLKTAEIIIHFFLEKFFLSRHLSTLVLLGYLNLISRTHIFSAAWVV